MATMNRVWPIFADMESFGESSNTVANMMGAKMSPRFSVRRHDGGCGFSAGGGGGRVAGGGAALRPASAPSASARAAPDPPPSDDGVAHRAAEVVRQVAPVVRREEEDIRVETRGEPPFAIG